MIRFAILDGNNAVINIAIGEAPLADNWIASDTALIGDIYIDGLFSTPELDFGAQWEVVRIERNKKLSVCDWTQLSDAPLTNVQTAAWAKYRQELRDITNQADPFNIDWPQIAQ